MACTSDSPRPAPPARRARPSSSRVKRSNTRSRSSAGHARTVVVDPQHGLAAVLARASRSRRDVAWRAALSSRLRTSRASWPGSPSTRAADTPVGPHRRGRAPRSRATSASTSSSRSTASCAAARRRRRSRRAGPVPAGRPTSSSSRSLSLSTVVGHRRASRPARGCRLATSTLVRMVASGLRSSWEASRHELALRWSGPPRAGRACRSWCGPGGPPRRRWSARRRAGAACVWLISSTSWRMRSTGRRARPTSHHVTTPTSTTSSGMPTHSDDASVWTLRAHLVERRRGHDRVLAARASRPCG